jgi:hypothetical protein
MAGVRTGISGQVNNNIVTDGLVFYIDPAYKISTTPSSDTVKSFNTINTAQSASYESSGMYDSSTITPSLAFDGTSGIYIDEFKTQTGVNQYTWNLWVKSPSSVSSYDMIMSTDYSYLYLAFYTGYITFDSNLTGVDRFFSPYSSNTWYNLTVCVDGVANTTKCYVNASEEHSDVAADTLDGHRLWLGRWYDGSHDLTNGNMGPVQIYNRALSAGEVLQNYQAQKERFGL